MAGISRHVRGIAPLQSSPRSPQLVASRTQCFHAGWMHITGSFPRTNAGSESLPQAQVIAFNCGVHYYIWRNGIGSVPTRSKVESVQRPFLSEPLDGVDTCVKELPGACFTGDGRVFLSTDRLALSGLSWAPARSVP